MACTGAGLSRSARRLVRAVAHNTHQVAQGCPRPRPERRAYAGKRVTPLSVTRKVMSAASADFRTAARLPARCRWPTAGPGPQWPPPVPGERSPRQPRDHRAKDAHGDVRSLQEAVRAPRVSVRPGPHADGGGDGAEVEGEGAERASAGRGQARHGDEARDRQRW